MRWRMSKRLAQIKCQTGFEDDLQEMSQKWRRFLEVGFVK